MPDPLGTCFECSAFSCGGHAELDRGSGKWICFTSVAKAAAASAGVGTSPKTLQLNSHVGFERRFPFLAGATVSHRSSAYEQLNSRSRRTKASNRRLLADAVGVARALGPDDTLRTMSSSNEGITNYSLRIETGGNRRTEPILPTTSMSLLFPGAFGDLLRELEE
jgi:hypothetical protein